VNLYEAPRLDAFLEGHPLLAGAVLAVFVGGLFAIATSWPWGLAAGLLNGVGSAFRFRRVAAQRDAPGP
jgi:F0F1-type ATP synthase assembly protein I